MRLYWYNWNDKEVVYSYRRGVPETKTRRRTFTTRGSVDVLKTGCKERQNRVHDVRVTPKEINQEGSEDLRKGPDQKRARVE